MVKHVQQTCGIQDPQQAAQYTQQAVNVVNEHGNNNPQGLQSLFSNFMGGGAAGAGPGSQTQSQQQEQQNQNKKKGSLGDVMSGLGI
ncbi:MAG TPA: hypothetical protein VF884_13300 [Nitrososphaeraceae archaeon]